MLRKIKLTNFQIHKSLVIELAPYVTTLIGQTRAGKSSILRALRWLCLNQPNGDAFVKHGTKECSVELNVDKAIVERRKGKGINEYSMDGKEYKAFGMGKVPDEIERLLNVDDVNFQRQMDAPFWFMESAGQVSKNLNQIVNLGAIDSSLLHVARKARQAKAEMELITNRVTKAKALCKELAWVKEAYAEYTQLRTEEDQTTKDQYRIERVRVQIQKAKDAQQAQDVLLKVAKSWESVEAKHKEFVQAQTAATTLTKLIDEAHSLEEERCRAMKESGIVSERIKKLTQIVCPTCKRPMQETA